MFSQKCSMYALKSCSILEHRTCSKILIEHILCKHQRLDAELSCRFYHNEINRCFTRQAFPLISEENLKNQWSQFHRIKQFGKHFQGNVDKYDWRIRVNASAKLARGFQFFFPNTYSTLETYKINVTLFVDKVLLWLFYCLSCITNPLISIFVLFLKFNPAWYVFIIKPILRCDLTKHLSISPIKSLLYRSFFRMTQIQLSCAEHEQILTRVTGHGCRSHLVDNRPLVGSISCEAAQDSISFSRLWNILLRHLPSRARGWNNIRKSILRTQVGLFSQ